MRIGALFARAGAGLWLAALLAACGAGETSSFEMPSGGRPLTEEEVQRAVQRILEPSETVPYPAVRMPEPPAGFARLASRLDEAEVETGYRPPPLRDQELLPPEGLALSRAGSGPGGAATADEQYAWLPVEAPGLPAGEIGEIVVRGSFGRAEHFTMGWKGGVLRIDVQELESSAEYVISTDGLTNFRGPIHGLRFGVSTSGGRDAAEIRLESVRLRDRRAAYHAAAGLARRRLAREVRQAVFAHGTTTIRFPPVAVVGEQSLSFGVAVMKRPVRLRLSVESAGETAVLFDDTLDNTDVWRDHTVPIAAAGDEMSLVAELDGAPEAVAFLAGPTVYRPLPDPPRILLYLIDTQRADGLSLYGYGRQTSPHLERLARRGGWFANAFANSSWTGESVPLLLTSTHTRSNGMNRMFSRLAEELVTLPEVLAAAGFATAAFSTNGNAGPQRGTDQGFDSFFDHIASVKNEGELRTVPIPDVVAWLESRRDRPVFLYVHTAEPHMPYRPPPPWDTMFDADYRGWVDGTEIPRPRDLRLGTFSERDLEHLRARYDGEAAFADRMFGALSEVLEARGLLDDTLIVVTSDHGEAFGEHVKYGHGVYLYPELVRVPMIFGGGGLPSVGRLDVNAQLLDLMPTLIELAGLEVALPQQGESLAPPMRGAGAGPAPDRPLLTAVYLRQGLRLAVIRGAWKLSLDLAGDGVPTVALFDMRADPGENDDLVASHPEAARRLLRDLVGAYRDLPRYGAGESQRYVISQEQIERLRALGYLE